MLEVKANFKFIVHSITCDFSVAANELIGITGRSGIGKSTLLKAIAGLSKSGMGEIIHDGNVWQSHSTFVSPQKRSTALVFQDYALFPNLSVERNLRFGQKVSENVFQNIIEAFDIRSFLSKRSGEISGGQQQRVALGRSLCAKPKVLLLDEPFSALDPGIKHQVKLMVKRYIHDEQAKGILVSHEQNGHDNLVSRVIDLIPY